MSIQQRVVKGYYYAAIFLIGYQLVTFVSRIFLYRILTQYDFGIYNIAIAFVGVIIFIGDLGVTTAVIQREGNETEIISTGLKLSMLFMFTIYVFLALSARTLTEIYQELDLIPVFVLLIITQMINIGGIPSRTIAQRSLEFKRLYITNLLKEVAAVTVSLYCAFQGFGFWSLIYGRAVSGIVWFLLSITYVLSPFDPRFKKAFKFTMFSKDIAKDLLKLGFGLFIATATIEIMNVLIPIFAGLLLNIETVGILSAVFFFILPFERLMILISNVTFSAFSRVQQDFSVIQKGITKFLRFSSYFILPYFVILEILGDRIIGIVLGEKWIPPSGLFQIIAWIVLILPFGYLGTSILKSLGKSRALSVINIARVIIFILIYLILVNSTADQDTRLIGLSIGILIQYAILFGLLVALRDKFHFIKLRSIQSLSPIAATILMSFSLIFLHSLITDIFSLVFVTLISLGIFYIGLYLMDRTAFKQDIYELIGMVTGKTG